MLLVSCVHRGGVQTEEEETRWKVIAYLLQLVQRALANTALLEVIL
jgi:hypothetical protein